MTHFWTVGFMRFSIKFLVADRATFRINKSARNVTNPTDNQHADENVIIIQAQYARAHCQNF